MTTNKHKMATKKKWVMKSEKTPRMTKMGHRIPIMKWKINHVTHKVSLNMQNHHRVWQQTETEQNMKQKLDETA